MTPRAIVLRDAPSGTVARIADDLVESLLADCVRTNDGQCVTACGHYLDGTEDADQRELVESCVAARLDEADA